MISLLIISDHRVVRAGLRAMLAPFEDLRILGESGQEESAQAARDVHPDVALFELPGSVLGGLDALFHLIAEAPDLAVVVLSDDVDPDVAIRALEAGARGYLVRDASPEEILEAIRAVHQGFTVLHATAARALLRRQTRPVPSASTESLTDRETEVLHLLAQGLPSKTIASRLGISENTVKFHVGSILGKLGASSRTEAVSLALRRGLISL